MLIPIIVDIVAVTIIVVLGLYQRNFKHFHFTTMLTAMTITSIINLIIIQKYDYISIYSVIMLILWTGLQLIVEHHNGSVRCSNQKYSAIVLTYILSLSTILTFNISNESYYMSTPYLAPAIFLIGAIILFVSTFKQKDRNKVKPIHKLSYPVTVGEIIIILSFTTMTILTPLWYIFLITHLIFIMFILRTKLFFIKND
ncbi:hypothetical protein N9R04_03545 [Staphylococcus sp. SQ8-PEA]|uniref:Uncharacterized protein n=1 Tax=Staphylococcus marylandisciuri TaxID=2981529 RepID=A0ABT2QP91_9STAP|nr:hypothetical protein [Staphylococcus marylandisciuri]MCU5745796.1 hypothetical protein [Staphylococcus marylandisciuri]